MKRITDLVFLTFCLAWPTITMASTKAALPHSYRCDGNNLLNEQGDIVLTLRTANSCPHVLSLIDLTKNEHVEKTKQNTFFCNGRTLTSLENGEIAECVGSFSCREALEQLKANGRFFCNQGDLTKVDGQVIATFYGAFSCNEGLNQLINSSKGLFCAGGNLTNENGSIISKFNSRFSCVETLNGLK